MSFSNPIPASSDARDYFGYDTDFTVAVTAAIMFGVLLVLQLGLNHPIHSTCLQLFFALGAVLEFAGFIGHVMCSCTSTSLNLWRMQVVMLAIGPSFVTRGLYYQFSKVTAVFGTKYAPIRPNVCSIVPIVVDWAGMIVVFWGHSTAEIAGDAVRRVRLGGICVQLATLVFFTAAFGVVLARIVIDGGSERDRVYETHCHLPLFSFWVSALLASDVMLIVYYIYRMVQTAAGLAPTLLVHERLYLIA